jgi:2-aminomuconate deaminase
VSGAPKGVAAQVAAASAVIPGMARPRGAFPHFRRAGDLIFVSGTSSRRADDSIAGAEPDGAGGYVFDIRVQTHAVLENIRAILAHAGATLADVVEVSTYLVSMQDFPGYNEVYAQVFGYEGPARTTVAVAELPHPHLRIEIRVVAWRPLPPGREAGTERTDTR